MTSKMQRFHHRLFTKNVLSWGTVFWMSLLFVLGTARAQNGSFIIPGIRANSGTDFAYWDRFQRPPGSPVNINYNYPNPPALLGGEDDDGNPTTAFASRTTLIQNGAADAFLTSSGAIYSFSEIVEFEVPYEAAEDNPGEITNVIFQTQTGGVRLNVNTVELVYEQAGVPVKLQPVFRGMDDPQTGAFSERIVCAFQWNLTGLNIRKFKIVFASPSESMPLWQAQLDVVAGEPFVQELGYLLATRSRPITRFGRAGTVNKNLPVEKDGRFFMAGDELNLLGNPDNGWRMSGWYYDGATQASPNLPLTFPARDITVTALFAPRSYADWREHMFYHANTLLGTTNDHLDDAISGPAVDYDEDGLSNAGEYAFAGDPYEEDPERTRPQLMMVEVDSVKYPALRYRTSGLQTGPGDIVYKVRLSANGGPWQDNSSGATTVTFQRQLQPDGSELITERTLQPMSSFSSVAMDVAWSVGGVEGTPVTPAPLEITRQATLLAGRVGAAYSTALTAIGGMAPYVWNVTSGNLPPGTALTASGTLSGLPTTAGEYSFTARVTDEVLQNVSRTFTVSVAPFEILNSGTIATQMVGLPVNVVMESAGGTGPYTWTLAGGIVPDGMELRTNGSFHGTPAVPGNYSFTVKVTDSGSFEATKVFTWTVFDLRIVNANPLPSAVVSFPYNLQLEVTGATVAPVWTRESGSLPGNLELSNGGVISGTPTAAASSSFTVKVTSGEFSTTKTFDLSILATVPPPVVNPVVFPTLTPGAQFNHTVTAVNYPKQFTITGLPKGLAYVPATGAISGRASVAGIYQVQIRATNAGGSSPVVRAPLVVQALASSHVGSFTGLVGRHDQVNGNLGSQFTLTTTTTGAFTLQVKTGSSTKSAKGFLEASAPQVRAIVGDKAFRLTLDASSGLATGTHGEVSASGWRLVWDKKVNPASTLEGYYSMAFDLAEEEDLENATIPHGVGYATFSAVTAGTLKITGKTADGQMLTAAASLGPNGEFALYVPLYASKGTLHGELKIKDDEGLFVGNDVTGTLTWSKPETKGVTYPAAFALPVNLAVEGGYLSYAAKGTIVLGLPDAGDFNVTFAGGGVEASEINPDLIGASWTEDYTLALPSTNDGKATLKVDKATGAVSGTFTLKETTPALERKNVKFQGQVVRMADGSVKAAGYFLLPQIPTGGQKPNTAPILSGAVLLTQPPAPAP